MAIYNDSGLVVRLTAYCGKHAPLGSKMAKTIVRGFAGDEKSERLFLMVNLSAGGGNYEKEMTIDVLPEITLSPAELKAAWASMD